MKIRSAVCAAAMLMISFVGFSRTEETINELPTETALGYPVENEPNKTISATRSSNRSHNIYLTFFESSNWISVSYDTRFPKSKVLGWRAGLGYSCVLPEDLFFGGGRIMGGVAVPFGVNALLGHGVSKFEVGVGVSPGIYFYYDQKFYSYINEKGNRVDGWRDVGAVQTGVACSFSVDLGYRLQRPTGFGFRIGFSPCISVNPHTYFHILSLVPYISFGYTFR